MSRLKDGEQLGVEPLAPCRRFEMPEQRPLALVLGLGAARRGDLGAGPAGEAGDMPLALVPIASVVHGDIGAVAAIDGVKVSEGLGSHEMQPGPDVGALAVAFPLLDGGEGLGHAGVPLVGAGLVIVARRADADVFEAFAQIGEVIEALVQMPNRHRPLAVPSIHEVDQLGVVLLVAVDHVGDHDDGLRAASEDVARPGFEAGEVGLVSGVDALIVQRIGAIIDEQDAVVADELDGLIELLAEPAPGGVAHAERGALELIEQRARVEGQSVNRGLLQFHVVHPFLARNVSRSTAWGITQYISRGRASRRPLAYGRRRSR